MICQPLALSINKSVVTIFERKPRLVLMVVCQALCDSLSFGFPEAFYFTFVFSNLKLANSTISSFVQQRTQEPIPLFSR